MRGTDRRYRAVLLAAVMLVSVIALPLSGGALAAGPPGDDTGTGNGNGQGGPPDHASVPTDNVDVRDTRQSGPQTFGVQSTSQGEGPPTDAAAWNVGANKHAEDLAVEIVLDEQDARLVLSDDDNHDAREVSVNASALRDALDVDELPNTVYGVHEDNGLWSEDLAVEDGAATFTVPEFSTNVVEFDGSIEITASPALDGDTFEYELPSDADPENLSIKVSGSTASEWDNETATGATDGETLTLDVAGNTDPSGPSANGEPVVEFSGRETSTWANTSGTNIAEDATEALSLGGNQPVTGPSAYDTPTLSLTTDTFNGTTNPHETQGDGTTETTIAYMGTTDTGAYKNSIFTIEPNKSGNLTALDLYQTSNASAGTKFDVRIKQGSDLLMGSTEGTVVGSGEIRFDPGTVSVTFDSAFAVEAGQAYTVRLQGTDVAHSSEDTASLAADNSPTTDTYRVANTNYQLQPDINLTVETGGNVTVADGNGVTESVTFKEGGSKTIAFNATRDSTELNFSGESSGLDYTLRAQENRVTEDPAIDLDGDGTDEAAVSGKLTGTATREIASLSTSDDSMNVSTTTGIVDVTTRFKERVETDSAKVAVNGNETSSTGRLSDGGSALLGSDTAWIRSGNNTVEVLLPDQSADAPLMEAGLNFSHDATVRESVAYEGEAFSERYEFSKVWDADFDDGKVRIPWASDRVIELRDLTVTNNPPDGSEYELTDPSYTHSNGELVVDVGDVTDGTVTNVTTTGTKLHVEGGEIVVTQPTDAGLDLDSKIEVTSLTNETLSIDVSGTSYYEVDQRLVYATEASWSNDDPRIELTPSTAEVVTNPVEGATMRLRTGAVGAEIASGDAVIRMLDPETPELDIKSGSSAGDTVELLYHDVTSGTLYEVVDSNGDQLAAAEADTAPVSLEVSDDVRVVQISGTDSDGSTISIAGGSGATSGGGGIPQWVFLIAAITVALGALTAVSDRWGPTGRESTLLPSPTVMFGGAIIGFIGIELASSRSLVAEVLDPIGAAVASIGGGFGLVASGFTSVLSGTIWVVVVALLVFIGLLVVDQFTPVEIPRTGYAGASLLVGVWAIESISGVSLLGSGLGGAGATTVLVAVGVLLGLLALDQRTGFDVPLPAYGLVSLLVSMWTIETISEGALIEPLSDGLDEIGPLVWLLGIVGVIILGWLWLRSRRPEIRVVGGGGRR